MFFQPAVAGLQTECVLVRGEVADEWCVILPGARSNTDTDPDAEFPTIQRHSARFVLQ